MTITINITVSDTNNLITDIESGTLVRSASYLKGMLNKIHASLPDQTAEIEEMQTALEEFLVFDNPARSADLFDEEVEDARGLE